VDSPTILILAALRVITARNPVHAALSLVLAFFTAAALWLLLEAEFLAIALVLVYVGWLIWGEMPVIWTYVGAAIVIASALYIAHREAQLARERRRAALANPPEINPGE
jgi:NADH:ubiquinone oxidoreductase subunit 6 (subunit J)